MYAHPAGTLENTPRGREAQRLLARCVHCGFCLPACPTYRVAGNELDSPRGRIYLVKQMVEGATAGAATLEHLDRCLTCRACESACPSGVEYGRIAELGRELAEERVGRTPSQRVLRSAMAQVLGRRHVVGAMVRLGSWLRPILPAAIRAKLPRGSRPPSRAVAGTTASRNATGSASVPVSGTQPSKRRVVLLEGCVQPALAPEINAATTRVLDRLGISVVRARGEQCCGALGHHLGRTEHALLQVRRNVAACDDLLATGAEAILSTASACGLMVKDYGRLLADDVEFAAAAQRVASATRDLSELVEPADLRRAGLVSGELSSVAWQSPCTLQHGQRITGRVESLLVAAGYRLSPVRDAGLCCGSAGAYSLLQPGLSRELRRRKLEALMAAGPNVIATANIGCLAHLRETSPVPVRHWIELLDAALQR
ncbi:MAG: glycolate oxidase subunit GlcF [Steroidobacteraceae bacterium]